MKIVFMMVAILGLLTQHCGSPGTNREATDPAASSGDQGKETSLGQNPAPERPKSIQIGLNVLKTSLLARRSCHPTQSPILPVVPFATTDNLSEFSQSPNIADDFGLSPSKDIVEVRYGRAMDGLAVGIGLSEKIGPDVSFTVEIAGIVVGDSIRSETLKTFLITPTNALLIYDKGTWKSIEAAQFDLVRGPNILKLLLHSSMVADATNWPVWSVRTSSVTFDGSLIQSRRLGAWSAQASVLGGDISTLSVMECVKTLEGGQSLTIQTVVDKRIQPADVQDTIDLAYTALLQSLPVAAGQSLPINRLIWLITDRDGATNSYRSISQRTHMFSEYQDSHFLKLDPRFSNDSYVNAGAKEEQFFNVVFDFFSRFTDSIVGGSNKDMATIVASSIANERLSTAFGIPAALFFNRNQNWAIPSSRAKAGLLFSQVASSRVLLQLLRSAVESSSLTEQFQKAFVDGLLSATPQDRVSTMEKVVAGWLTAGPYTQSMEPTNFGDTDRDGIPDALEVLIGTNPNKADSTAGGLNDMGRFSVSPIDQLWLSRKPSEIVVDGSVEDWKALIPNAFMSDKDETLNTCSPSANINLFGSLVSKEFLILSALSKAGGIGDIVSWEIQIDVPSNDGHFLLLTKGDEQTSTLFKAGDVSSPIRVWRQNAPLGRNSWEIFVPNEFLNLDPRAHGEPELKVRITAHADGKLCDDTPWFSPIVLM